MRLLDWVYEKPYDFVRMIMKYCFGVEYKDERKNKEGQLLCLILTCNELRQPYKTSDRTRNYCKKHDYEDMRPFTSWASLKDKALKRDKYTCVKCKKIPEKRISKVAQYQDYIDHIRKSNNFIREDNLYIYEKDYTKLIGDHIKPIALGGDEWDIKNIQTLCSKCNKIKTKQDHKKLQN